MLFSDTLSIGLPPYFSPSLLLLSAALWPTLEAYLPSEANKGPCRCIPSKTQGDCREHLVSLPAPFCGAEVRPSPHPFSCI